jgi:hypothetical protein
LIARAGAAPADIESRQLALADRLGFQYGAVDLILTPERRHVLLEPKPAGELEWLQESGPGHRARDRRRPGRWPSQAACRLIPFRLPR